MLQQVGRRNHKCSKLGIMLSCSICSQRVASLNPTQGSNLDSLKSHKERLGRTSQVLSRLKDGSGMYGISTPEWVRVLGINTPLSKTSRCSVSVRPVRPVDSNKLAVGPRPVRPVGRTGHSRFSAPKCFSLIFLTWDGYEHFW